jgi:hypothetical protein
MKWSEIDERLQEQQEHLGPLLELSPSATVITDLESRVVACYEFQVPFETRRLRYFWEWTKDGSPI